MSFLPRVLAAVFLVAVLAAGLATAPAALAQGGDREALIGALTAKGFSKTGKAIDALAATGDPAVAPVLEALSEGDLYFRTHTTEVYRVEKAGRNYRLFDPLTGEAKGEEPRGAFDKIKVNNRLRRQISAALGALTLMSPDPQVRRAAAEAVLKAGDPEAIGALETALEAEQDPELADLMRQARAAALLNSEAAEAEKVEAVALLRSRGDREVRSILAGVRDSSEGALAKAAADAVEAIDNKLAIWSAAQNVWYGLSLGSVLLLAAIGLAITFGVMGVINMAHGEMVMIGAYTTFVVQEAIRTSMPGLFDYSLFIALPLAFLVSGAIGVAIERGIIRFLYGRPLETLLATWGISLVLQQAVRTIFGPTNQEVGNPSWMSGAFELGNLTITYNRMWILFFAFAVFLVLIAVLQRTRFGLFTRAVTQNRAMASSMGIRTPWVDAMTFGLGSGIAGIAGVALSQIDNVSPNLGQGYIIDSFMVVVFGGVGNLWGTVVGAMTLGVVNKFLEPYAGAVLGKILVLVFIILFIQKRPRGLFALKGRAVES